MNDDGRERVQPEGRPEESHDLAPDPLGLGLPPPSPAPPPGGVNLFVLSHHREDELHRTWRLGPLHVCARCLGLYPTLAIALTLQFVLHAPLTWKDDDLFVLGLTLPGLWDWSRGVSDPASGNNPWRTASGALLGAALGRSLYIHLQTPLPRVLLFQLGLICLFALPALARRFGIAGER